ncbi:MAG: DNA mismatch repair endonuclease MutL [Clostridia bacterium]|nr:DNA mismatch repair endonuclease MutL [Clostridia bacterium]
MSKINVLDKKVYTQIAAGEVVERPSSVVKELVENSIDAGATEITVNIVGGGKDLIEVVDNGSGILKEDIEKAILPHATSKISTTSDLSSIKTLGFRGEALPSIASVSKIKITSNTGASEIGYTLETNGLDKPEVYDCPSNKGTYVTVENLFYNTPARQKFLKTERSEENDVQDVVSRLILANPNVSIKYYVKDSLMINSYGEGIEDAIVAVYGNTFLNECFKISNYVHGVKIEGYIGKINHTKSNRTYQTVILNGRYIVNQTIQTAVFNAYSGYLMKRRYPQYVLYVTVPEEIVDVNVTPNKTDVRFIDNSVIYGAIYSTISKVLDGTDTALDVILKPEEVYFKSPEAVRKELEEKKNAPKEELRLVTTYGNTTFNTGSYKPDKFVDLFENFKVAEDDDVCETSSQNSRNPEKEDVFAANKRYIEELELKKAKQESIPVNYELKYIGQALNAFLIFEMGGDLYLVDQHAAHERLLYNKFINQRRLGDKQVQPLLIPYVLKTNSLEYEFIMDKLSYVLDLGFEISPVEGGNFNVYAVPNEFVDIDFDNFFNDVLSDYQLRRENIPEVINDKIIQKACKSAIKAGMKLNQSEVDALITLLNGNINLKCPHGRPIAVKISRTEIDKWFKRIV